MKKFFKAHPETVLVTLAALFIVLIVGYFAWGIGEVVAEVNQALKFTPAEQKSDFNIQGAESLNLRGLQP
jgi:hypothetical protein